VLKTSLPAAVLFDMDGTIVDTEPYWIGAEVELAERDGGRWTAEDGYSLIGNDLLTSAQVLRERGGIKGSDEEIVQDLLERVIAQVHRHGVPWRPGAEQLLRELREAGVPCALVTMSYTSLAEVIVASLPEGTFRAVVTGDSVTHGKPHPEPYLTAAELLDVPITHCIAIEDSPTGIASAEAAGAWVIGVELHVSIEAAPLRSRLHDLAEIDLAGLAAIAGGTTIDRLAP
jgi:HAD superfamily hydrolase (TIGR01509 family)